MVAPRTADDFTNTNENAPVTANVVANDTDAPENETPLTIVGANALGRADRSNGVSVSADGSSIIFDPNQYMQDDGTVGFDRLPVGASQQVRIDYNIMDSSGEMSAGFSSLIVTVVGTNDAPTAPATNSVSVDENMTSAPVAIGATDVDMGDTLTFALAPGGAPTNGTVAFDQAAGTFTFTPNANFFGTDSFTIRTMDSQGAMADQVVTANVSGMNDVPVANEDQLGDRPADREFVIQASEILGNDTDTDGGPLRIVGVANADGGTVRLNDDGSVTFTPIEGLTGPRSFDYSISDGRGGFAASTVRFNLVQVAPVTNDDVAATSEDAPVTIMPLANDTDANGDMLNIRNANIRTDQNDGSNGTITIDQDADTIVFDPGSDFDNLRAGETQTVLIDYNAVDDAGNNSTPAFSTITVTVTGVNDAPITMDDVLAEIAQDSAPRRIEASELLGNDVDPEGDPLNVSAVGNPNGGTVVRNDDGSVTFTPAPGFNGPASFDFTVNDGQGGFSRSTATFNVRSSTTGTAGNDVLTGTPGNDFFTLDQGGDDTANGLGGDDAFIFGDTFNERDIVNGGDGNDQIGLQGDYSRVVRIADVSNVEAFILLTNTDDRFGGQTDTPNSYNLSSSDSNVAAGRQLIIDANALMANENSSFDGTRETDGRFFIFGGRGVDTYAGGSGDDVFLFRNNGFDANDRIDGNGNMTASGDQLGLQGIYTGENALIFNATTIVDLEGIVLLSGQDVRFGRDQGQLNRYDIRLNDANVAAGQLLTVDAGSLRVGEFLTFNGSGETDGRFRIFGGDGNDTITGGRGNDTITGGLGNDVVNHNVATSGSDAVNLGGGTDVVRVDGGGFNQIRLTFTSSEVGNGNANRAADGQGNVSFQGESADGTLTGVGAGAVSRFDDEGIVFVADVDERFDVRDTGGAARGENFQVVVLGTQAGETINSDNFFSTYYINAGMGDDIVNGGAVRDFLVGGAGNDRLTGGGSADTYIGGAGADIFALTIESDSFGAEADRITDFTSGTDRIDLSGIDANRNGGNGDDMFTYVGSAAFSGTAGQLRSAVGEDGRTFVEGDTNGDGVGDFTIFVEGPTPTSPAPILTSADFIL